MPLYAPEVLRPSEHLLLIRRRRQTAWIEAGSIVWVVGWWYAIVIAYRASFDDVRWLWWVLLAVPAAIAPAAHRYFAELPRRCRRGDEFAFDSMERTITRNGQRIGSFQNVTKVVFRVYRSDRQDHDIFQGRIQLDDGTTTCFAWSDFSRRENDIEKITRDVAAFLDQRMEIEYASHAHGEPIRSLDLTQRELDRDELEG